MLYYKGLIEMRKAYSIFYGKSVAISFTTLSDGALVVKFNDNTSSKKAIVVINPTSKAVNYTLDGNWKLIVNGINAGSSEISSATGNVTVGALDLAIYVNH